MDHGPPSVWFSFCGSSEYLIKYFKNLEKNESEIYSTITHRDMIFKMQMTEGIFHENQMIIFRENEGLSL
jgi:hypothetical protein